MQFLKRTLAALAGALLIATAWPLAATAQSATVIFAAASTADALNAVGAVLAAKHVGTIATSYASSSTLAKQIENGAPAAIFLSADEQWMDYIDQRHLVVAGTRSDLLGNALVMIAPKSAAEPEKVDIATGFPLAKLLGDGRLALGDPSHVPAGLYAKAALEKLAVWDSVKDRVAAGKDVRAALAYVERGETPLGVVYSTDAAASDKVRVVGTFPEDSHPPILYPVALVAGHDSKEARAVLDFLKGPEAKAIFAKFGFRTP